MNPPEAGPRRLNTGVIGVGHLGSYHLQKLARHPSVARVLLYDLDVDRAETEAGRLDAPVPIQVCSSLSECLEGSDTVSVAVPTSEHFDIAWKALNAGCDVLVEKPITASPDEAWSLVEAAETAGRVLQVGHVERFNPALQEMETTEMVPGFIEAHRLAPWNPRGTDVPVIHDLMVHDIDLILHLVGEDPSDIQATGVSVITDTVDIANARLTFPGGCVANVTASRISLAPMRKLRIFQRDAYVSLDLQKGEREIVRLRDNAGMMTDGEQSVLELDGRVVTLSPFKGVRDALAVEIDAFLRAVVSACEGNRDPGPPAGVTGREAARVLRVAEEITRAIGTA